MEDKVKNDELQLERTKRGCEMFVELSKAQIQFSLKALQGLLIINGGAATAVLAANIPELKNSIYIFATGALFAVLGFCAGYFANRYICETWRSYIEELPDPKEHQKRNICKAKIAIFISCLFAFVSAVFFAWPIIQPLSNHIQELLSQVRPQQT